MVLVGPKTNRSINVVGYGWAAVSVGSQRGIVDPYFAFAGEHVKKREAGSVGYAVGDELGPLGLLPFHPPQSGFMEKTFMEVVVDAPIRVRFTEFGPLGRVVILGPVELEAAVSFVGMDKFECAGCVVDGVVENVHLRSYTRVDFLSKFRGEEIKVVVTGGEFDHSLGEFLQLLGESEDQHSMRGFVVELGVVAPVLGNH